MKHHPKTALETTMSDLKDAIVDVARSVSAPVPSGEQDLTRPRAADSGEDELWHGPRWKQEDREELAALTGQPVSDFADEDDEDFDSGDPPLFDPPLTDRQEAAAFHAEEIEQEFGVASRFDETDDWNEPTEEE